MPYSSGTYSLPSGNPVVTGTTISSSTTNTTNSDIATALSTCVLKDGTQTITANLPMASHKLTGLSAGTTAGDSVEYGGSPTFTNVTTTGQFSSGSTFGFKNLLIDAGFTINQRAYVSAATLASGAYGHDRWKAGASGGDYSFAQNNSSTTITIASGKSLIQVVEDKNVNGTSFVLSWTGTAQARYAVNSATPAGSYAASPIVITGQTQGTTMSVEFNTGTLSLPQLEKGSVATSFDYRPYGTELSLCQRYYQNIICSVNDNGAAAATKAYYSPAPYQCKMRVTPTATFSALEALRVTSTAFTNAYDKGATYTVVASGGPSMSSVSSVFLSAEL